MKTSPPSSFSNTLAVATTPSLERIAQTIEELPQQDLSPRKHRHIVPMDVLPIWPEIERLANEAYDELADADLPLELVGAFLESPEMKADSSKPLTERARLFLERLSTEE